jgi:hypothetical protein
MSAPQDVAAEAHDAPQEPPAAAAAEAQVRQNCALLRSDLWATAAERQARRAPTPKRAHTCVPRMQLPAAEGSLTRLVPLFRLQAALPPASPPGRRATRAVPGLCSGSDSGSDTDASQLAAALVLAAAEPPSDLLAPHALACAALATRRLSRTRAALAVYKRMHWQLLERLREQHRRYVICHGHIGSKEGAHAAAQRREAICQPPAAPCAAPGCEAGAMALCGHCFTHVCLEPGQQLYRPAASGAPPRLCTEADPVLELAPVALPAAEPMAADVVGAGAPVPASE